MIWRLHPEPGSKWYRKGPHWRYCTDPACELEHFDYTPFVSTAIDMKCDPR